MKIVARFWRHNQLAAVVCMFGLFWCGVAAVMILLYAQLVQQQGKYLFFSLSMICMSVTAISPYQVANHQDNMSV